MVHSTLARKIKALDGIEGAALLADEGIGRDWGREDLAGWSDYPVSFRSMWIVSGGGVLASRRLVMSGPR